MNKLVYLSQPSRLGGSGKEDHRRYVIEEVTNRGMNIIHPFEAFPYERFEGNPAVGRELALQYCCDLIDACAGGMILSGISEGTLIETAYLLENHPNRELYIFSEFDPLWDREIERLSNNKRFVATLKNISQL